MKLNETKLKKNILTKQNQSEDAIIQIETEFYREYLHTLYLLSNKINLDLFFQPNDQDIPEGYRKNSSGVVRRLAQTPKVVGYFGHRAGRWILKTREYSSKPFTKEFTSKKKAIKFMKENFKTPFLLCVRYKRGYDLELADVPVQFYMHNLGDEQTVETVIYRYDWKYILDKEISSDEYFQKHKEYILGQVEDEEINRKEVPEKIIEPKTTKPVKNLIPLGWWLINSTAYTLFGSTLGLWIYTLVENIHTLKTELIILGSVTGGAYLVVFIFLMFIIARRNNNKQ